VFSSYSKYPFLSLLGLESALLPWLWTHFPFLVVQPPPCGPGCQLRFLGSSTYSAPQIRAVPFSPLRFVFDPTLLILFRHLFWLKLDRPVASYDGHGSFVAAVTIGLFFIPQSPSFFYISEYFSFLFF